MSSLPPSLHYFMSQQYVVPGLLSFYNCLMLSVRLKTITLKILFLTSYSVPSHIIVIHIGNSRQLPKDMRDPVCHKGWLSGIVVWCNLFNLSLYNTSESSFYLLFSYLFLRFGNYFWSLQISASSLSRKTI